MTKQWKFILKIHIEIVKWILEITEKLSINSILIKIIKIKEIITPTKDRHLKEVVVILNQV